MKCFKKGWWSDIGLTILHWVLVVVILARSTYSAQQICVMLLIKEGFSGWLLASVFLPSHYLEEILGHDHGLNPTLHVLKTTRNVVSPNRYLNNVLVIYSGGLNLQIEHHMFPQCPIDKLPQLAAITRNAVERRGLEYRSSSFVGSFIEILFRLETLEDYARRSEENKALTMVDTYTTYQSC